MVFFSSLGEQSHATVEAGIQRPQTRSLGRDGWLPLGKRVVMFSERPPGLPKLPYLPFRPSLHAGADPSAALGRVVRGSRHGVDGAMGNARYLRLPPFSLLINLDQHNAQHVPWQIIPLVTHCY